MYQNLAILAAFVLVYSAVAGRLEKTPISGAIVATWMSFGAAVVGQVIGKFSWPVLIYSLLSLTVVRMLPVYLSLAGSSLKPGSKLFLGWFGPRGLASVVFAVIVLEHHLPGGQELALTAACTVILSILAHGFSANPLAASLGEREASGAE